MRKLGGLAQGPPGRGRRREHIRCRGCCMKEGQSAEIIEKNMERQESEKQRIR